MPFLSQFSQTPTSLSEMSEAGVKYGFVREVVVDEVVVTDFVVVSGTFVLIMICVLIKDPQITIYHLPGAK